MLHLLIKLFNNAICHNLFLQKKFICLNFKRIRYTLNVLK